MPEPRPPFVPGSAPCAKCLHHNFHEIEYRAVEAFGGQPVEEWLERECRICHYAWEESCADA